MAEGTRPHGGGWIAAAVAGLAWVLLCLRWFDAAASFRPRALGLVPPWLLAALLVAALALSARRSLRAPPPEARVGRRDPRLLMAVAAAVLFRLPLAVQGGAAYVTADGALSGLMALDVRDGRAHPVFVPHVPYSGSLKAHLTAPLAAVMDGARAFALVSLAFYAAFVAALVRLADAASPSRPLVPLAAGLYAAFAPPFVTRYSLSNDGNYVEVLALGTWAMVLALRAADERVAGARRAVVMGLLLGLAFWCHILAVIPAAAVVAFLVLESPRATARALPRVALGFALGDLPGLLWNAGNAWDSLAYLRPGAVGGGATQGTARSLLHKAWAMASDQLPVLLGYDFGYPRAVDRALAAVAVLAALAALIGIVCALRRSRGEAGRPWRLLLVLTATDLAVALLALPYIPGNPRYLLFLMASVPVFIAQALAGRRARVLLAFLVAVGAASSLAQGAGTIAADGHWRSFVRGLEEGGVRWCYTDFFLATRINFLSDERITCSAKLGPTTTEYFFRFREAVEAAPEAALIAVNASAADKLARRLDRLGVGYRRQELMKPVLLSLSRKVDPQELFPDRAFPLR